MVTPLAHLREYVAVLRLAGAVSDGAISWNSPPSYIRDVALPALRASATHAGRQTPPLIAHIWVALSDDPEAVVRTAKKRLAGYARLPFCANTFAAAGNPVEGGGIGDALVKPIVVQGAEDCVTQHLTELLGSGLDELLLTVVPVGDVSASQTRLFQLIGRL